MMSNIQPMTNSPDKIKPRKKPSRFTYFMWWCSGAVIEILERQPTEKNKFVGMGFTIFGTYLLATASGIFAFNYIFKDIGLALILGCAYGAIIFNLDRYITSSMRKHGNDEFEPFWYEKMGMFIQSELLPAIPRLAFAIIIGIAISKPLELKMFETEILKQLDKETYDNLKSKEERYRVEFNELREKRQTVETLTTEIESKYAELTKLRQGYIGELDGTGGSGKVGKSLIASEKEEIYEEVKRDYERIESINKQRIELLESEIATISKSVNERYEAYVKQQSDYGFLDYIGALNHLTHQKENSAMRSANILIIVLIALLESAPIMVKLISPRGPYDAELNRLNRIAMLKSDRELRVERYQKKN